MRNLLLIILLLATPVFARWQDLDRLYENLENIGLSQQQNQEIELLFKNYHYELKNWWKADREVHYQLFENFETSNRLDAKLNQHLEKSYKKKAEIDWKFFEALYHILTQEQREKFAKNFNKE